MFILAYQSKYDRSDTETWTDPHEMVKVLLQICDQKKILYYALEVILNNTNMNETKLTEIYNILKEANTGVSLSSIIEPG